MSCWLTAILGCPAGLDAQFFKLDVKQLLLQHELWDPPQQTTASSSRRSRRSSKGCARKSALEHCFSRAAQSVAFPKSC